MRELTYLTIVLLIINLFFAIRWLERRVMPVELTDRAMTPVIYLFNSKLYWQTEEPGRSIAELESAIVHVRWLMGKTDSQQGKELLLFILPQLESTRLAMEKGKVTSDEINEVYVKTLLALSFLQVEHAYENLEQPDDGEGGVRHPLRRAMYIVKKALILSEGTKKDYEVEIYSLMNSIVKGRVTTTEHCEEALKKVMKEIRTLEVSFSM